MYSNAKNINIAVCLILIIVFMKISLIKIVREISNIYYLKKFGQKTEGKIVFINNPSDSGIIKTYFPKIQFTHINGKEVSFYLKDFYIKKPALGSKVEVFYHELDPTNVIVNSKQTNTTLYFKLFINVCVAVILILNLVYNAI